MQRAPKLIANNEAFDERPALMGALCADCEEFRASTREDDVLFIYSSLNHSAIWNPANGNSCSKVWFVGIFHSTSS